MPTKQDIGSTVVGAGAGYLILNSIKWPEVWGGETTHLAVGLLLILAGCLMYRGKGE